MKKFIFGLLVGLLLSANVFSQELYVFTKPASNMPAKSVGLQFSTMIPTPGSLHRFEPEVMLGINKNWMVHLSSTFSNYYSRHTSLESGKLYAKYRFYSNDEVHQHFRMAAYGSYSYAGHPIIYHEVNLDGDTHGAQVGLVATQLVNKTAVSANLAYTRVLGKNEEHAHEGGNTLNVLNYSLSTGYLLLPKHYTNYKQTNVNLYIELLGMKSLDNQQYAFDAAPAIQFIFNSNTKLSAGYRFQALGNMSRIANQQFLISIDHTLFNVF